MRIIGITETVDGSRRHDAAGDGLLQPHLAAARRPGQVPHQQGRRLLDQRHQRAEPAAPHRVQPPRSAVSQ